VSAGSLRIGVVEGDITRQDVDAVVNAANNAMRGGGGVDGAIHRAGGREVLDDCIARFPDGLATGDAGWTTAGRLPARWVIHVVGPNRHAGETDRSLLTSCYARAVAVADELGARTVAFPLVSAGIYVIEREVLEAIPADRPVSLEREVWPLLLDGRLRGLPMAGAFTDMGVPDAFAALQADPSPLVSIAQGVPV